MSRKLIQDYMDNMQGEIASWSRPDNAFQLGDKVFVKSTKNNTVSIYSEHGQFLTKVSQENVHRYLGMYRKDQEEAFREKTKDYFKLVEPPPPLPITYDEEEPGFFRCCWELLKETLGLVHELILRPAFRSALKEGAPFFTWLSKIFFTADNSNERK